MYIFTLINIKMVLLCDVCSWCPLLQTTWVIGKKRNQRRVLSHSLWWLISLASKQWKTKERKQMSAPGITAGLRQCFMNGVADNKSCISLIFPLISVLVDLLVFYHGLSISCWWRMNTHTCIFQFLHQFWQRPWRNRQGFPLTGSVFQTFPKLSCRQHSRRVMGVWPVPSRTPQISGGTEERCFGTEPPLCHSLKPKACGSGKSENNNRKHCSVSQWVW